MLFQWTGYSGSVPPCLARSARPSVAVFVAVLLLLLDRSGLGRISECAEIAQPLRKHEKFVEKECALGANMPKNYIEVMYFIEIFKFQLIEDFVHQFCRINFSFSYAVLFNRQNWPQFLSHAVLLRPRLTIFGLIIRPALYLCFNFWNNCIKLDAWCKSKVDEDSCFR